jgi:hypothetical protein
MPSLKRTPGGPRVNAAGRCVPLALSRGHISGRIAARAPYPSKAGCRRSQYRPRSGMSRVASTRPVPGRLRRFPSKSTRRPRRVSHCVDDRARKEVTQARLVVEVSFERFAPPATRIRWSGTPVLADGALRVGPTTLWEEPRSEGAGGKPRPRSRECRSAGRTVCLGGPPRARKSHSEAVRVTSPTGDADVWQVPFCAAA